MNLHSLMEFALAKDTSLRVFWVGFGSAAFTCFAWFAAPIMPALVDPGEKKIAGSP